LIKGLSDTKLSNPNLPYCEDKNPSGKEIRKRIKKRSYCEGKKPITHSLILTI